MIVVFVLGYLAIALEHSIKIDKAASALITGVLCWAIYVFGASDILGIDFGQSVSNLISNASEYPKKLAEFISEYQVKGGDTTAGITNHFITHDLLHHLSDIGSILFFLLGAMTIVELVDAHEGFRIITDRIETQNKVKLLWITSIIAFFFSAVLDNLTTAIVMSALLKKLIKGKEDQWMFAGVIIIAANAGGAWSPIGDVTTIMLWIGGQITALNIVTKLVLPSLVCMIVPLIYLSFTMKGNVVRPLGRIELEHLKDPTTDFERNLVFAMGVGGLLFVPIFKTVTHLPPFMGMMLSLGVLWVTTEILHRNKKQEQKNPHTVIGVLKKVDVPTIYFFLGILIAVASLQSAGHLRHMAEILNKSIGDIYAINIIIGLLSSIVDNVPLVAGAMGMYDLLPAGAETITGKAFAVDHPFWEFLAYCAGTGGSCLIIGSAAGVAVMGILKIDFIWYIKKISMLALIGYLAGAATYYLMFVL